MAADSFPQRLTAIDDVTRGDHWYLRRTDVCRYLGAYTAGKGFAYSATNGLILNFKMAVSRTGRRTSRLKEKAITGAAAALRRALEASVPDGAVFVPVPPSQAKEDEGYDDRLVRRLRAVRRAVHRHRARDEIPGGGIPEAVGRVRWMPGTSWRRRRLNN